jgi:glycyl-tRNA synthetase
VELKRSIKDLWWKKFVATRPDIVGLDSSILLNPKVWEASGHVGNFSDPLVDCKVCRERARADHLLEAKLGPGAAAGKTFAEIAQMMKDESIQCPKCGSKDWTEPRSFNLMFKTEVGVVEGTGNQVYLRPETAQGIFIDFKSIVEASRQKLPFGVGQIGKSFRNEITPGNFIFRTREFEQMEMEFFCRPGTEVEWYDYWKKFCMEWLGEIGLRSEKLRLREHEKEELSHYSNGTSDIEYEFPFGWGELWGIASRTNFDLTQHMEHSKVDLRYHDKVATEKFIPIVVEPALGVDRLLLALLCDAYEMQTLENGEERAVFHFHPSIAPVKAAILPLSKDPELMEVAEGLYKQLIKKFPVEFDETQSIGKRYRRQDEIGTPWCVTIDFGTVGRDGEEKKGLVTIRDRDTMQQVTLPIEQVENWLLEKL